MIKNDSILEIISELSTSCNLSEPESWWLLEYVCKKTKEQLLAQNIQIISLQEKKLLEKYVYQIIHEYKPLAYILGHVPFYEIELEVMPPILIPRPETEEFVIHIIQELKNFSSLHFLDIGTGTGCIGISLAHAFAQSKITMTDISEKALSLAQKNSIKNQCGNVEFISSDVFGNLLNKKFDIIISNPPYIDPALKNTISPHVKNWEDGHALFAQDQGLAIIKNILKNAHQHLSSCDDLPFKIALEVDHTQPEIVCKLALEYGFKKSWHKKDSFGNPRFVFCL